MGWPEYVARGKRRKGRLRLLAAFLVGLAAVLAIGAGSSLWSSHGARERVRGWVCGP